MSKISLNEIMGKMAVKGSDKSLSLDDLQDLLGERMPELKHNPVGRLRLITALKNRFGKNWRSLPGMNSLMKEFDKEIEYNIKMQKMKMIKAGKK